MRHYNRFLQARQLAPFFGVASATVLVSYGTAIFIDAKKRQDTGRTLFKPWRHQGQGGHVGGNDFSLASLTRRWKSLSSSQQTIYSIIAANTAVFLAWRVPACSRLMHRYFLHAIDSHPLSMIGSMFSHKSLAHLGFNMLALNSFGGFLHDRLGREQFCAFYMSAGAVSSLGSHLYKSFRLNFTPSLGASGAIFGIVGSCSHFPALKVSLIFLPMHSVPIGTALPVLMGIDLLGLLRNWAVFDHAAHLSGALTGYFGYSLSNNYIWPNRQRLYKNIFGA